MKYKEYLCKTEDGYILQTLPEHAGSELIEVPDGAEKLTIDASKKITFWNGDSSFNDGDEDWSNPCDDILTFDEYAAYGFTLLWQRPTQPETINDQYAEIEKVRQSQIGGNHYSKLAIQPMEYSLANGLDAGQHTVIKYVTRFKDKGGIEDLHKAKHTIDLLIAHYYGVGK